MKARHGDAECGSTTAKAFPLVERPPGGERGREGGWSTLATKLGQDGIYGQPYHLYPGTTVFVLLILILRTREQANMDGDGPLAAAGCTAGCTAAGGLLSES